MHAAARYNRLDILRSLLQNDKIKPLVNSQDNEGKTPLHAAVQVGDFVEFVDLLLQAGANINAVTKQWKYTPMHWIAKRGA